MNIQYIATLFRNSKSEYEKIGSVEVSVPHKKPNIIKMIYDDKFKINLDNSNKRLSNKQFILLLEPKFEPKTYSFYLIWTNKRGNADNVINIGYDEKIRELTS